MDKKLELKRLLIYLAFSFGLSWLYFILFIANGFRFDVESNGYTIIGLGMLFPFIANVLTRWVTKEGFAMTGKDSLMLGISFKNKKWIYFLFAVLAPWIYNELVCIFRLIIVPKAFDPDYYMEFGISKTLAVIYPLAVIVSTVILSFAALGEEGGWRGYMMPKLMNLMGYKKAILVGGIIWGVWHAPLTCVGHNFGSDYPGFPYLGILIMCVFCTLMGIILTFVTMKTGSIWPAAIMHAVNNGGPSALNLFFNEEVYAQKIPNGLIYWAFLLLATGIFAVICFILSCKEDKMKNK